MIRFADGLNKSMLMRLRGYWYRLMWWFTTHIGDKILPAWQIGRSILRVRDHHVKFPEHGHNCACLDADAGKLRRLIFGPLPFTYEPADSLPDGSLTRPERAPFQRVDPPEP